LTRPEFFAGGSLHAAPCKLHNRPDEFELHFVRNARSNACFCDSTQARLIATTIPRHCVRNSSGVGGRIATIIPRCSGRNPAMRILCCHGNHASNSDAITLEDHPSQQKAQYYPLLLFIYERLEFLGDQLAVPFQARSTVVISFCGSRVSCEALTSKASRRFFNNPSSRASCSGESTSIR